MADLEIHQAEEVVASRTLEGQRAELGKQEEEEREQEKVDVTRGLADLKKNVETNGNYPPEIEALYKKYSGKTEQINKYWDDLNEEDPSFSLLEEEDKNLKKDIMTIWGNKKPRAAIEYFSTYEDKVDNAEVILEEATDKEPLGAITYFDSYSKATNAEDILKTAAKANPREAIEYFDTYHDKVTNAEDILKTAAKANPREAIKYFDTYHDKVTNAEDILKTAAKANPMEAIEYFDTYYDKVTNAEVILKTAAKKQPITAIKHFGGYVDKVENAEAILKEATERCPRKAIEYFSAYEDKVNGAEAILEEAAKRSPGAAIQYFSSYVGEVENAEEILKEAVIADPGAAIEYFSAYVGKVENAKDILKEVAQKEPAAIIEHFHDYLARIDGAEEILKIAINKLYNKDSKEVDSMVDDLVGRNLPEFLFVFLKKNSSGLSFTEKITDLFNGMISSIKEVQLGQKIQQLTKDNLNIYSGILKTYHAKKTEYTKNGSIDRETVKKDYETNINAFIKQGEQRSESNSQNIMVTYIRASEENGDDHNGALDDNNNPMLAYYTKLGGAGMTNYEVKPDTPDNILEVFSKQVQENPDRLHLFHLGAHGRDDGGVDLAGGDWTKKHFHELFNIAAQFPYRVKIDFISCNSKFKGHNNGDAIKNVSLDSGKHPSIGGQSGTDAIFLQAFKKVDEADFDGDTIVNFNEALLYRAIHYNKSLTPIMMDDGTGKAIDIAMDEGKADETQTG